MEWTRGHVIGRGSTAAVSLATTAAGEVFAVKSTDISRSSLLRKEQYLVSQLSSPYIVKCLGSDTTIENDKHVFNLFLEYVPGGTLSDLIKKQGKSLDESVIQFYALQMLQGLNYLHLNGLVHCDIKGQNMLIHGHRLKIADFGCAKLVDCGSGFAGTPAYMAPEVARGEEQSFPADIWAFGCTVIEMATGSNPWPEMKEPASALYRIGYSGDVPEYPIWFSDRAKDFLSKCFTRDPKERWTAAELLQHEFFSSIDVNHCGEMRESNRESPTSVIDQGFWDAIEVSSSSREVTDTNSSSSDIPSSRIRVIGDVFSGNLDFPDWTEEEDWVTVRDNETEECSNVHDYGGDLNEDYVTFSSIDEEEFQISVLSEDSLFNSFSDEISVTGNSIISVILSESVKYDFASDLFIFNGVEIEVFSHHINFFFVPIFPCIILNLSLV